MKKSISVIAAAVMAFSAAAGIPAEAAGWNKSHTRYELSDGTYASGLFTADGIKYLADSGGELIGPYTGWTRTAAGVRNYYREGRRCAGWRKINGKRYYFYYEGGAAVGEVQLEDKIYIFDKNGVFTGRTKTPAVYTKNVSEVYYADKLPGEIPVSAYYTNNSTAYFDFAHCSHGFRGVQLFSRIERYKNGKWCVVEPNLQYIEAFYGKDALYHGAGGRGDKLPDENDPDGIIEDVSFVETEYYHGLLAAGKYRAVFCVRATPEGLEKGVTDREIYSYFTIK